MTGTYGSHDPRSYAMEGADSFFEGARAILRGTASPRTLARELRDQFKWHHLESCRTPGYGKTRVEKLARSSGIRHRVNIQLNRCVPTRSSSRLPDNRAQVH